MKSCQSCKGTKFRRKKVEFVTRVGEHQVIHSLREDVCASCGAWVLDPVFLAAYELTSASKVLREQKLNGAMIKDVRRLIRMPPAMLAKRLGIAEDVVSG